MSQDINIKEEDLIINEEVVQPETPWVANEKCEVNFDNKISEEIIKWGTNKDLFRQQMLRKERVIFRINL